VFDIPSIRIGRVFGIPIEVNFSWFIIFALLAFSLSTVVFPSLEESSGAPPVLLTIVGMATALLFFASILAHELSHSLVAKAEGADVDRITLFIFGGVAQIDEEPRTPLREFLMAAAGPGMSLLIAAACSLGYAAASVRELPWWIWAPLQYLAGINLLVALFNLLPGFPLDGGRVLRSVLWGIMKDLNKATRWASRSGQFIGWTMVFFAVTGVLQGRSDFIWFGLVGWFISSLAGQAYRQQELRAQTEGVKVASIMSPSPEYVSGEISLEQLVQRHFLGGKHSRYPVMVEGSIVGTVSLPDVKRVPREDWPLIRTLDVTERDLSQLVVSHDDAVSSVLGRLSGDRPGALLVVRDGHLAGIVTRADVIALLDNRST
jgi:Zn-dependent protease